jgi:hypothetical protein
VAAPAVQQSLLGVSGIDLAGGVVRPATNQYEICFKCHADSSGKPQATSSLYGRNPVRATWSTDPFNLRLDFNSAAARHNVTQPARGGVSPSLRLRMLDVTGNATGPLLSATNLYCTDCHNNDDARASRGAAANGPHGSKWTHLLERQYQENVIPAKAGDPVTKITYLPGTSSPYALCDKCHDLDKQLNLSGTGADTVFGEHYRHVVNDGASCSVCHAAHGVQGGNDANNKHLVNFDIQIVQAYGSNAQPYMDSTSKQCFLTCHGTPHNGTYYPKVAPPNMRRAVR